jgi:hypothetical protein
MLKDVRLEATVDPVQGVKYEHYDAGKGDGSGFVVCLIPEGENKPYRAAIDPAKQYYQRIGDSFAVIPHAMLRSLFYPRGSPHLGVEVSVQEAQPVQNEGKAKFAIRLSNCGTATARDIFLTFDKPMERSSMSWADMWSPIRNGKDVAGYACLAPLHPGQSIELCSLGLTQFPSRVFTGPYGWGTVRFGFIIYTSDHAPQAISVEILNDDLWSKRTKQFWAISTEGFHLP